jgi:hypothetical protein
VTATQATVVLTRAGVAFRIHEYDHAVARLGLYPAPVFETAPISGP